MMPEDQMMLRGTVIEWEHPVPAKVFDWRDRPTARGGVGAAINSRSAGRRRAEPDVEGLLVEHDCVEPSARLSRPTRDRRATARRHGRPVEAGG